VSTERASIEITVNGEVRPVPRGETISGLLVLLGLDPERVAVELDGRIVKQPHWTATELRDGAQLEIVQFVGGG
jgi:thiamine biosynthesis protein ThiS